MTELETPTAAVEPMEPVTDPIEPAEAAVEPQDAAETDAVEGDGRVQALSAEAKKWRQKLRDEQERTASLQSRVDTHDREAALRIASEHLSDGEDLFLLHDLDTLRDPDGGFSEALTREALAGIAQSHPHWLPARRDQGQGVRRPAKQPQGIGAKLKSMV